MTPTLTHELHPCARCARPIRATYPACWRCPPRLFRPHPGEPARRLGTWRRSRRRETTHIVDERTLL